MKLQSLLVILAISLTTACKTPSPVITDDTMVTSDINGVALNHLYVVEAPKEFTPVNARYRVLFSSAILNKPDFDGKILSQLENDGTYTVLGQVDKHWFAIAGQDKQQLLGYVPVRALIKSEHYAQPPKKDRPRVRRTPKKTICVAVDNSSKACQNANNGTWIID